MELLVLILGVIAGLGLFDLISLRLGADSRILSTDRTPRQEL
jgi:hypothetical protein